MNRNGFSLIKESFIDEINAKAYLYKHEKTGAELVRIENDDTNKVFAVAFNTYPESDNGVCHIIEHSVLSGSEKYPLKEPFVNLMKGSLNTFLNAMTFADRTVYPVASQNHKDFMNLIDVYLDSVFNPLIYKDKLTFMQEGWHFEFDENGEPFYTGVVYNEMKGAMSSPDSIMNQIAHKELFDNIYKYNSGGDPKSIVNLTYEYFINFHKKYYHPSNARFFVYGDCEFDVILKKIDEDYISKFERVQNFEKIKLSHKKTEPIYIKDDYPSQDGINFAGIDFCLGDSSDKKKTVAMQVISNALFGFESSPIKLKLIEKELCQDVYVQVDDSMNDTLMSIVLHGVGVEDPKMIEEIVLNEIKNLTFEEIKDIIRASLTNYSFALVEGDTGSMPKGVIHCFNMVLGKDNEEDFFAKIRYKKDIESLYEEIEDGSIMNYINEFIINNTHRVTMFLKANQELDEMLYIDERNRAKEAWEALSNEEKDERINLLENLWGRQDTPDSPELLALMPKLSIDDLKTGKEWKDVKEENISVKLKEKESSHLLLHYEEFTQDIMYIDFLFPIDKFGVNSISALSAMASLIGNVDTEKYNFIELNNKILNTCGNFSTGIDIIDDKKFFSCKLKVFSSQIKEALELTSEILLNSKFDNLDIIESVFGSIYSRMQMDMLTNGNKYAEEVSISKIDEEENYSSMVGGFKYYEYLKTVFSGEFENLVSNLKSMLSEIISRENMIISLTGDKNSKDLLVKNLPEFLDSLPDSVQEKVNENISQVQEKGNTGYIISSPVQYVGQCGKFLDGEKSIFNGHCYVLQTLLNTDYLWNTVRVKGGAYGASCSFSRKGYFVLSSYRDPNCSSTLDTFKDIPSYLENLDLSEDDMLTLKIGAVSMTDRPLTPIQEGSFAVERYFKGISSDKLNEEREEILETKLSDLKIFSKAIKEGLAQNIYNVFGSKATLTTDEKIFDSIENI